MVSHNALTDSPPNIEVTPEGLDGASLSQQQMYVRCNFVPPPQLSPGFELVVPGRAALTVTVDSFEGFAQVNLDMVLECAGNGRAFMDPLPDGVAWGFGGVSPVAIAGVRLTELIGSLPEDVVDVVFTGADGYQFAIGRDEAMSKTPILVTHIGAETLDLRHGGTIRLIVPGQYAMKSVKWLTRVEAVTTAFRGHFVEKYRFYDDTAGRREFERVGSIYVRSIISSPVDGQSVPGGGIDIHGSAWTGTGEVSRVEVSLDGGDTWKDTDLIRPELGSRWAPIRWSLTVEAPPGEVEIMARATDSDGNTQPLQSRWNRNGYANNVVHRVPVTVI